MESARIANDAWPALRRDVLTALLASGLAAFGIVVLLLLARRITGALVQPLGGLSLVAVAALGLLLAVGWRLGWQIRTRRETSFALLAPVLPGAGLFVLLCVLSLPGTANWALMLTWLAFLTGEAVWWWTAYSWKTNPVPRSTVLPTASFDTLPAVQEEMESNEDSLPQDAFQQITRYLEGEQERVAVMLRVPFAAGQRVGVAHIAFCPPLCGMPELAAEVREGPTAAVAITSRHTFGARLEVRLDEPAGEPCAVEVEVAGETLKSNADRAAL